MMMVKTRLVLLFFMSWNLALAQFPYTLNKKTDFLISGVGLATVVSGQLITNGNEALTISQVNDLNSKDVNSFDRNAINNYSESSDKLSEAFLMGTAISSLSLLADKEVRQELLTVGVMGVEVLALNFGLANMSKGILLRNRPYAYNPEVSIDRKLEVDARYSFYSRTTATTASISFFTAKVFSDLHPNSKWKPVVWGGAIIVPALTAYAKVDAGEHFYTDVLIGYSMGALIGYFVPVMHLKSKRTGAEIKVQPNMNGVIATMTF
ncbi:MAG: phosphatase PAP2 family protein [Salibacteraceae bacterium]